MTTTTRAAAHGPRARPAPGAGRRELGSSTRTNVFTTRVGLLLPPDLPFEEWAIAGRKLFAMADSSAWCLGDWLAHGQQRFRGRYEAVSEELGLDTQTLRNYAWLARRFDHGERRHELSLQHHCEVASLPVEVRAAWLARAVEHSWSRNALRRAVRESKQAVQENPNAGEAVGYLPRVQVGMAELASWEKAAEQCNVDLSSWVRETLHEAARSSAG